MACSAACGLGIGYISPVSTLIKWFPDRPGMATGMAIMGFGGGALIAAPLSLLLMAHFKTATSNGVMETFVTMGVIYFMFMMIGVYSVRVPAVDWKPAGWVAAGETAAARDRGPCRRRRGLEDPAILAAVDRAVHERDRRNRRAGPGFADDPGDLQRAGDCRGGRAASSAC